ncbi:hypothetical protein JK364_16500 [Streptomyces sp. 110]|uniref:Uncharacterized protein n=1 Tax=Streptomyces endocoffeicus TaxID=2898945 RepID=A0ABS1PQE2_9ACTN|nr:hypothetical protein [Streptomyces endocoffeicus]MBL1113981.1 hypothetical protein [Streptomyces endocoffeicus]
MRHRRQAPAERAVLIVFRAACPGPPLSANVVLRALAVHPFLARTPTP